MIKLVWGSFERYECAGSRRLVASFLGRGDFSCHVTFLSNSVTHRVKVHNSIHGPSWLTPSSESEYILTFLIKDILQFQKWVPTTMRLKSKTWHGTMRNEYTIIHVLAETVSKFQRNSLEIVRTLLLVLVAVWLYEWYMIQCVWLVCVLLGIHLLIIWDSVARFWGWASRWWWFWSGGTRGGGGGGRRRSYFRRCFGDVNSWWDSKDGCCICLEPGNSYQYHSLVLLKFELYIKDLRIILKLLQSLRMSTALGDDGVDGLNVTCAVHTPNTGNPARGCSGLKSIDVFDSGRGGSASS